MTTANEKAEKGSFFFYGWVIVGLSFFTLAFHISARFSFAIFQVPLIAEFGWGRGALGGAYALMMAVYAFFNPFMGSLIERKGPRAVMPWASVCIGGALAAGYFITSLWHVYVLTGIFIGAGTALSGFSMHSALMPRWFARKRGLATGIALSGIGIGSLVLSPVIERMISAFSWRAAYLGYGIIVLLILAPAKFLLLRNRPEDVGQALDGLPPEAAGALASPPEVGGPDRRVGETFRSVRGDSRFWVLIFIGFTIGFNANTLLSQLLLFFVDAGYGTATGAIILGMTGVHRIVGSVGVGWLSDRIGRLRAFAAAACVSILAVVLLLLTPGLGTVPLPGYLFALLFGFGTGGMSACYSALAGDNFKGPTFGVIMGFIEISYALGGAVGPSLAGFAFDLTESYLLPFSLDILLLLTAVIVSLLIRKGRRPSGRASGIKFRPGAPARRKEMAKSLLPSIGCAKILSGFPERAA